MILTYEDTRMLETPKGGFKTASLIAIGVEMPPKKGWRNRLVGTEVDEADFARAIEYSESPLKKKALAQKIRDDLGQIPLF